MKTSMSLGQAIRERRSIGRVKSDEVEQEKIEQLLEAANWAPCHHGTEPWRFYVMTGNGRQVLADAYADIAAEEAKGTPTEEEVAQLRNKQGAKAFRSPVVIAVAASPSSAPNVSRVEELAATHAAVQNMLLTAHAIGLAAIWRSGEPMYHPRMKQAFQLKEEEELVALVYVGYPAMELHSGKRKPVQDKTVWIKQ
ncbi:nitroreductase family protein [Paenibacillus cremeus]|uniref:Putative NAD(P)H nitroreductase n=1 Tax=Paenibacillus cremeus TaxID=2163881 RepID=A0A559KAJ3_9BACL|nr:nitroreductase [Paenibacillus cremeus]TVY09145.1 nitroreductase [Paenibacillus cremeus]